MVDYIFLRLHTCWRIIDSVNMINRDMNMAKVYGIDYESVMTRGSQFRVEAMLTKMAKATDHLLLSASPKQVSDQNELEVIPLVIEPDRNFYIDPVVVVDFQSLYPSLIIAYNLCFSTCLGKIQEITPEQPYRKFGAYQVTPNIKQFFGYSEDAILTEE